MTSDSANPGIHGHCLFHMLKFMHTQPKPQTVKSKCLHRVLLPLEAFCMRSDSMEYYSVQLHKLIAAHFCFCRQEENYTKSHALISITLGSKPLGPTILVAFAQESFGLLSPFKSISLCAFGLKSTLIKTEVPLCEIKRVRLQAG